MYIPVLEGDEVVPCVLRVGLPPLLLPKKKRTLSIPKNDKLSLPVKGGPHTPAPSAPASPARNRKTLRPRSNEHTLSARDDDAPDEPLTERAPFRRRGLVRQPGLSNKGNGGPGVETAKGGAEEGIHICCPSPAATPRNDDVIQQSTS
ncbi:hypothetical protein L249_2771 [Ophiocordyceps polyrhachis-furcata BCC 54312]|uniref:Uncharacterized protein n=1 Tax=Ophiocordyceps polyrhachis-furcata BCC 54312 TaxID=1330021 RepID=A0A367LN68_9HYPO|nr:hypothetical protein L249_2771 [Ophiocordyceps polyrhachis-furcata BCC 54312]